MAHRRGWRPMLVAAALGLAFSGPALAQSAPQPPIPPPAHQPPSPPKTQKNGEDSLAREWRDSLADWMLWEGSGDLAVGHIINDPLTTGFGNADYLEPTDRPSPGRATKRTASIDMPQ